ncbi:MAG: zinc ribbon domain-containing protein, partial [Deltaproteobacteria bacterium]|nr:zinc ribbon domain-containing protein [Deltaproteobacteria bacterium]
MCEKCKKPFTLVMSISECEKGNFACPACKGKDIRQLITTF